MGLALSLTVEEDGKVSGFNKVWDFRNDQEGMYFADSMMNETFIKKSEVVEEMLNSKKAQREERLGWHIQPVKK